MNIFCIDTETTGTDIKVDKIIEIGACLYNVETNSILDVFTMFIDDSRRPTIADHITRISGITEDILKNCGINLSDTILSGRRDHLYSLIEDSDYIAAHNGNQFDKPLLYDLFETYRQDKFSILFEKLWIDTITDIVYPSHCNHRNMTYVAAFHGFLNPFPHKAVFDACCVAKLLSLYDINKIIEIARSPAIRLKVDHPDVFSIKDKIYKAGFHWENEHKYYFKDVKQILIEQDIENIALYGFDVVLLER